MLAEKIAILSSDGSLWSISYTSSANLLEKLCADQRVQFCAFSYYSNTFTDASASFELTPFAVAYIKRLARISGYGNYQEPLGLDANSAKLFVYNYIMDGELGIINSEIMDSRNNSILAEIQEEIKNGGDFIFVENFKFNYETVPRDVEPTGDLEKYMHRMDTLSK